MNSLRIAVIVGTVLVIIAVSVGAIERLAKSFRDCDKCPEMVVVPAGIFQMGSPNARSVGGLIGWGDLSERPIRRVEVSREFAIGRYEVTVDEYRAFAEATDRDEVDGPCSWRAPTIENRGSMNRMPSLFGQSSDDFPQGDDYPVVCVNWNDAQAYVQWLSQRTARHYRLPSEAEWEYAARAGTTTPWYWDDDGSSRLYPECMFANSRQQSPFSIPCDGASFTAPVGSYLPNSFRLYDMAGNVLEWVEDCWLDNYRRAPSNGEAWHGGDQCRRRVLRGGSWNTEKRFLRSAARGYGESGHRGLDVGFRVAATLQAD